MYADKITPSMAHAIDETNRRRAKQVAHNEANGVDPQPLRKKIHDILDDIYREAEDTDGAIGGHGRRRRPADVARQGAGAGDPQPGRRARRPRRPRAWPGPSWPSSSRTSTDQMLGAARELQFELAARIRDEISELKKELRQMDVAGAR